MTTQCVTPEFRVSYPNVFTPRRNDNNGKDEYQVEAIFPLGADLTMLKAACKAAAIKKWGEDTTQWPTNMATPFKDQSKKSKLNQATNQMELPDGYVPGAVYCSFKSQQRPGLVDSNVQPIIDQSMFYGGCYALAQVNASAYSFNGNNGVALYLNNLQKTKDGDTFGSRTRPEDAFTPIAGAAANNPAIAPAAQQFTQAPIQQQQFTQAPIQQQQFTQAPVQQQFIPATPGHGIVGQGYVPQPMPLASSVAGAQAAAPQALAQDVHLQPPANASDLFT